MSAAGIVLAALAAACFDGAVVLQALEVRTLAPVGVGAGLLGRLLGRPRWLAATALAVVGWPLHVAALSLAPLTVVQPALALGLLLLLALGARVLHEAVRARDLAAAAAIAGGLALLASASPSTHRLHAGALTLAAAIGALALVALVPWVARAGTPRMLLVAAAGCGYAASGLTSTLLADALRGGSAAAAAGWAVATAVVAGLGLADEMGALQRIGAARVAAGAFALQTAIPVLLAPLVAGERWPHPAPVLAGLALVLGGSFGLGAARAVSGLVSSAA